MKSQQLTPVPIYLVGNKDRYWKSFDQRLRAMATLGTLRMNEVEACLCTSKTRKM